MKLIILQHIEREGPALFLKVAKEMDIQCYTVRLDLGESLPVLDQNQAFLILGGPMGINDRDLNRIPWLLDEIEFIKKAIIRKVPMIGVCLGAQLIAYAAGGYITKLTSITNSDHISEIGWSEVNLLPDLISNNHILNNYFPMNVLHWHSDRMILPKEALLLASSNLCKEQLFLLNDNIFGLQFHIELDEIDLQKWIHEDYQYIISNLGIDSLDLLKYQNLRFLDKTLIKRTSFIKFLLTRITDRNL